MKVSKVIRRFAESPSDQTELRRVARSLGSELPLQRTEVLREFRAGIANTSLGYQQSPLIDDVSYAAGYVDSMLDVTAEYETAFNREQMTVGLSDDVARGIRLAIELFHHLLTSPFDTSNTLATVAVGILDDPHVALEAVQLWERESCSAGLITEPRKHETNSARVMESSVLADSAPTEMSASTSVTSEQSNIAENARISA